MNLDSWRLNLQEMARAVGETFEEPDTDWAPMLFVYTDKYGMQLSDIPGFMFENKDRLAGAIRQTLKELHAELYGVLISSWRLNTGLLAEGEPMPNGIADHPEREEILMLLVGGKNLKQELWTAVIHRDGEQPPGLGEWENLSAIADTEQGRFAGLGAYL